MPSTDKVDVRLRSDSWLVRPCCEKCGCVMAFVKLADWGFIMDGEPYEAFEIWKCTDSSCGHEEEY